MTQPMDRTPDPARTGEPDNAPDQKRDQQDVVDREQDASLGNIPAEQSPGHEHDNPDTPDEVHPALKVDEQ